MEYTLAEVIEQEIESYRPINKIDTGFYAVGYSVDENGVPDEFGQIMIYSGPFDENHSIVENKNDIPQDGWMHNDNCQCDDCTHEEFVNNLPDDWDVYFDDIEGAIEMLETEEEVLKDCIKKDELVERIAYLRERKEAGDRWVDNDTTSSPDAWKSLATFDDEEAEKAYENWTEE